MLVWMGVEHCIFQPVVQKFNINDAETLSCCVCVSEITSLISDALKSIHFPPYIVEGKQKMNKRK